MPWCECPLGSMPWRECLFVGMQWMQMPPYGYIMTRMLWCKHNLFKNSLYFWSEASSASETKIFSKLDLLFLKSHLLFDLRLPKKNWWSLLEIFEWGIDLESDDLAQKIYFRNLVKKKGVAHFQGLFSGKMNSLKIKHLKKIHFFSLNMAIWQASRPTVINSGIQGKAFRNRGFKFLFWKG